MPSFGQQKIPENSEPVPKTARRVTKSLEDFANEVFDQLNEKPQQAKEVFQKPIQPAAPVFEQAEQRIDKELLERGRERKSSRPELAANRPLIKKLEQRNKNQFDVPNTKEQLVQAIITSEIFGPPKAKKYK